MHKLIIDNNKFTSELEFGIKDNTIIIDQDVELLIEYKNLKNTSLDVIITNSAKVKIFEFSEENCTHTNIKYTIKENSHLDISKIYNNKTFSENITINLDGENSSINYNFITISSMKETYNIVINHNAKNTKSDIINKAVTLEEGEVLFQIDSNLPKGIKGCILNQTSRIIPFNNKKSVIIPNMFIDEYDTEAKHGSVIGKFKEEDVFYLMTRGIPKNEAIKLLVKGFVLSGLIINMETREKAINIINKYWR